MLAEDSPKGLSTNARKVLAVLHRTPKKIA